MSMAVAATYGSPLMDVLSGYVKNRARNANASLDQNGQTNAEAQAQARVAQQQAQAAAQARPNGAEKKQGANSQSHRASDIIDVEATLIESPGEDMTRAAEARAAELASQAPMTYASTANGVQFIYAGAAPGQFINQYA